VRRGFGGGNNWRACERSAQLRDLSIDALLLLGTAIGVKGQDLAPEACQRLASAASMLGERRLDRW